MRHLKIKNLDRYQHYKTRNPPWIKLYRSVLSDYELRQMPIESRLCFLYLTIIATETDNKIPEDLKYLSERFGFTVTKEHLTPLIDCGSVLASSASDLLAHDALCSSLLSSVPNSSEEVKIKSNGHTRITIQERDFAKALGIEEALPPTPPCMPISGKPKGKRAISENDCPTDRHREFARSLGVDVGPEWGKFKNYCLAHDKRYANFEAAFRNWLANAGQYLKGARQL